MTSQRTMLTIGARTSGADNYDTRGPKGYYVGCNLNIHNRRFTHEELV